MQSKSKRQKTVQASGVISFVSSDTNMYGCLPCPTCNGKHRASYRRETGLIIECDDCGFKEPGHSKELEEEED